jgi:hypothetical protein
MKLPTDAILYFIYKFTNKRFQQMRLILSLFRLFPFTLHVSGPYWPIIRGVLSCYYATIDQTHQKYTYANPIRTILHSKTLSTNKLIIEQHPGEQNPLTASNRHNISATRTTDIEKQRRHQYDKATSTDARTVNNTASKYTNSST